MQKRPEAAAAPADQRPEPPENCPLCPRLVAFRAENAKKFPTYHNRPVETFGDAPDATRLLVVGLAPGLHGANQTARPFTGDYAGDLLYSALANFGFSNDAYNGRADDGLELKAAAITNAVRCVPPQNKPVGAEIAACRPFLSARIAAYKNLRAILCLGRIAHDSTLKAFGMTLRSAPFSHGGVHETPQPGLLIFDSYHCSRYNTNTGRLTSVMFDDVFSAINKHLKAG